MAISRVQLLEPPSPPHLLPSPLELPEEQLRARGSRLPGWASASEAVCKAALGLAGEGASVTHPFSESVLLWMERLGWPLPLDPCPQSHSKRPHKLSPVPSL